MHPMLAAQKTPDKPAIIMAATGETVTFKELEDRSNQAAQLFRSLGLKTGDAVAIFMENNARFHEICWAAQRSGLYFTAVSSRLTAGEVEYIVKDSGAKALIVSHGLAKVAEEVAALIPGVKLLMVGGTIPGYASYEDAAAKMPAERIADETSGAAMLYSSGTTGRPKGVRQPLSGLPIDAPAPLLGLVTMLYGITPESIYLSPAPLYHAAPLHYSMTVQRLGATVVVMEHFDAEASLAAIQTYRCSASQWVPTMFVRMLKMPEEARLKYDVSSMKSAIHAAAPIPIEVKRKMIEWWGPVLHEYYAGTEGNGMCYVNSADWLTHPGTVGKSLLSPVHICDEEGNEVGVGEEGTIYFASAAQFTYHNDPKKTAESRHPRNPEWSTLGDVGKLDEEGYLYLTDRKAFMIISGGVNIYPQEAENLLITHPKVADVAVIGVPNEDFGEEVKAVVQPLNWADAGPALAEELIAYCRAQLSPIKCPRSIDFDPELPRHPTGKLYKRLIRDRYWGKRESRIV
ncbi:MAG TPA: acyl-CoA synthetase [Rhizomicrobium sp.]|jgi:acyl-CoA synthetase (AMP-forming)/AMP-acid ligase II|nr:acyl-CoA synthetase [Rhizomicrobium sp.]